MNYWYVARPNELFLDIDNASRSLKHAKARLQGAIECGKLDVAYVMQRPSKSQDHIHAIVTLNEMDDKILGLPEQFVWEIILHGDLYRGCCTLMRYMNNIPAQSILISPFAYFSNDEPYPFAAGTWNKRHANDSCSCNSKHNAATMQNCPAAIRLRGEFRNAGFFGKPSKNPCTIWPEMETK